MGDENGKAKFPLPILSYILMFTGLAISLAGAFLGINKPAHCYFFVLGVHLLSLGCLHLANAQGIRSFSSLLDKWDSCCKQKTASIFIGTVANFIFTALELYTLFNNDFDYDDFDCSYGRDGWMYCYAWPDLLNLLGSSLALAPTLDDQKMHYKVYCINFSFQKKTSRSVLKIVLDCPTPNL